MDYQLPGVKMSTFTATEQTLQKFKEIMLAKMELTENQQSLVSHFNFGQKILLNDISNDSLEKYSLIVELEEAFDIKLDDKEIGTDKLTLDDMVWLISFKLKETDELPTFLKITPER